MCGIVNVVERIVLEVQEVLTDGASSRVKIKQGVPGREERCRK